jgi:hypothetical protein
MHGWAKFVLRAAVWVDSDPPGLPVGPCLDFVPVVCFDIVKPLSHFVQLHRLCQDVHPVQCTNSSLVLLIRLLSAAIGSGVMKKG